MTCFSLLWRFMAILGFVMVFTVSVWGETPDIGNTCGTATAVSPSSTTNSLAINAAGDKDYFQIIVAQSGILNLSSTSASRAVVGRLYNSACTQIASNTGSNNFSISQSLSAGTYYVSVEDDGNNQISTYNFVSAFVLPSANLALTNTDSSDPVVRNGTLVYTLGVSNSGPNSAADLNLTDTLPPGVTYQSANGAGWSCSQTAGVVTCTNPALANGASTSVAITVTAPTAAGMITNTATVTSAVSDPILVNNTDITQPTTVKLPQIGWEQATYETAENTALAYGLSSQMPMRIVLDTIVDYPINVTYQTYNGTAIGDSDYRIAGGTVTIPAGENSITVNMDIYHDEAIELAENFTVVLSNPTGSGGVELKTDRTTAPVTITEQNTAPMCYSDNFNAVSLDSTWRTLKSSGTFSPQIVSNRLRLTPAENATATAVTKDYEFASAQNLIIVEFTHYAYGGSGGTYGADGMALVLYDTITGANPTPGAFGGSMGYAQKSNPGSDCTVAGGCPGFQGGWLGLGIDEFYNYSNPTEGRVGGPGPVTGAVAIRGDGSGLNGYEYLAGTGTLSPQLAYPTQQAARPGDKFRMTVDARDTAHLYIKLERDTGSGYVTIINQFDAKLAAYNQSTTPDFIRLALTGSTGGYTNIHEVDDITVWGRCTPYNPNPPAPPANTGAVDVVDNYPTNGYTARTGLKTKIAAEPLKTLDAVWLGTAGGADAIAYYTAGNNNVLPMPVLFYVTDINATNDNGSCTNERYQLMGANGSPLVATLNAGNTYARTTSTYTVQAQAKQHSKIVSKYINFYGMYLLDSSITCLINSSNSGNIAGLPQCVNSENQYKSAFGQAAVDRCRSTLNGAPCVPDNHGIGTGVYNHAYGCYQCTVDALSTGIKGCSSDAFAIRPDRLNMTSADPHYPNLLRSADDYNTTIHAYQYNSTADAQDYNVTSASSVIQISAIKYNRNDVIDATMYGTAVLAGDFNMTNGISEKSGTVSHEVAGLKFDDVGKIDIHLEDQIWSAVDNDDTPMNCDSGGTYVCGDTNVTFIPHHFDFNTLAITNNNGNPGSFTYLANEVNQMAARIDTQMRALNKNEAVTRNFAAFPLWENPVTVTPIVRKDTYLYPDANETTITNYAIEFGTLGDANGTKTIAWNETNSSKYLRFNFQRDVNQSVNPFDLNGSDLNISITSAYSDPVTLNTATITGERNAAATGISTFVYGRINPLSVTVYGTNQLADAQSYVEVYNTAPMTLGGAELSASKTGNNWWINNLHTAAYGDANVTVNLPIMPLPAHNGPINGMTTYIWAPNAFTPPVEFESHIKTMPWLWYGANALPYQDPNVILDCARQPCFNVKIRPTITSWIGGGNDKGNKTQQKTSTEQTMGEDMLLPRIRQ